MGEAVASGAGVAAAATAATAVATRLARARLPGFAVQVKAARGTAPSLPAPMALGLSPTHSPCRFNSHSYAWDACQGTVAGKAPRVGGRRAPRVGPRFLRT